MPTLPLSPRGQKYAWGKTGDTSVVASLKAAGDDSYKIDADQTYAEMWIGTHPSGPSNLLTNSGNLGPLLKVWALCALYILAFRGLSGYNDLMWSPMNSRSIRLSVKDIHRKVHRQSPE